MSESKVYIVVIETHKLQTAVNLRFAHIIWNQRIIIYVVYYIYLYTYIWDCNRREGNNKLETL